MSDNLDLSSVTTIVHDLKTPITSIMGFIELLQKDDHDEEKRQSFYDIIATESARLLKMVNDVLYVSRTSEQKLKDNKTENNESCNIGMQIHKYVKELAPLAEKRNINVDINMNESNIYVSIPESKVARILTNIIENAIKYNRESGKVFIDVSEEGSNVIIRIKDTGMGIASDELDKVFDKFYRSSSSKNIDGTGLGLAIAKDIVESYGGEIKVESELGKCTEFMISLPISKFEE